jgi:rhodanese-related sulfurtransferase
VFYFAIREGRGLVLTFQEMAELRRSEERLGAATAVEPDYPAIDEDQWRRLAAATKPVLLDIQHREDFARGHLPGAVNIPVNELYYRIPSELFRARALVVDCPQSVAKLCPGAAFHLARAGFTKVSILHR